MLRNLRAIFLAVVLTFVITSLLQPASYLQALALQAENCTTFRETGKTVCGKFLQYWQQHGGLAIFGYPISNPFREVSPLDGKEYLVQYFERNVFELHPENKPPHEVLLSQLGTFAFRSQHPEGEPGEPYMENLPIYPNAQNVKVERTEVKFVGGVPNQTVFETRDNAESVLAFYKEVMEKNGWAIYRQGSNLLHFVRPSSASEPVYDLRVVTKVVDGLTTVELRLKVDFPR